MLLLVPHLFPPPPLLEIATQNLRLPALQALLARGTRTRCLAEGTEAALCTALGISRQQDWPLAPITLTADGGMPGSDYWLRADPVHLSVMRDRIVLAGSSMLALTREESDSLAETINAHFATELDLLPLHPQRWYLRYAEAPCLTTTPLSVAVGRDIDPLLPQGERAMQLRAHMNEVQMLLHDHPVNQRREGRGQLAVNSVWIWGGGHCPPQAACVPLFGPEEPLPSFGSFCQTPVRAFPEINARDASWFGGEGFALLDALTAAGQVGDAYGWREALRELEQAWFAPLLKSLPRLGAANVRLVDPVSGTTIDWRSRDAWRLWRRPSELSSGLG